MSIEIMVRNSAFVLVALSLFSFGCKSNGTDATMRANMEDTATLEQKDLMKVGALRTAYEMPYFNDHSIIYNPQDNQWHLYGISMDPSIELIHLTADSLTQAGWKKEKPFVYMGKEIWAPHIIYHDSLFYMFYTSIGVPREIRYTVSSDLNEWSHPSSKPLLALTNAHTDNMKNKDPMVFRDTERKQWVMYYSMMKDDKHWVVGYSTSKNLTEWSAPKICFDEHTEEPNVESPFVVKRGEYYYLFLSARPWPNGAEEIFRSKTPYLWKTDDSIIKINPWHAAEVIRDLDGKWYLTLCTGTNVSMARDFRIAPFLWNDGLEDEKTSMPIPCCKQ